MTLFLNNISKKLRRSRTYLASVINPWRPNGKSYTIAFTQSANNTVLETYFLDSKQVGLKREGKKLYERAVAPGT